MDKQDRDHYDHHLPPIAERLRDLGVPEAVVSAVDPVTKRDGEPYPDLIQRACAARSAST